MKTMTQIGDNNIIDNNAESSVEKRIPYLTTISPHAATNNNDDPPKKYGHFSTLLHNELKKHNLYKNSPRYLESQTFDDMKNVIIIWPVKCAKTMILMKTNIHY